jgi:rubrerythrin
MNNNDIFYIFNRKKIDDSINTIKDYIEQIEVENEELHDKLNNYDKDSEIKKLNTELEDTRKHSLLVMSDKEQEAEKEFRDKHYKSCKNGNEFIYTLTGTGIGTGIEIQCPVCGKKEDITDTESW